MSIINALKMGVVVLDGDLKVEQANGEFCRLWQLDPALVTDGTPFADVLKMGRDNGLLPVEASKWDDSVKKINGEILEGNIDSRELSHPNGTTFLYSAQKLDNGKRLLTYYDITEQKRREEAFAEAEQKAVLADRAKSEFLANMSHEIRTPMNGVLGMSELLARTDLDSKQKAFTDIIVKSGNALLTIINDILDFSKIDAGQLTLDPAPFVLAEAIEDVATLVSTRAKEKDLELIVRVEPGLPESFNGDVGRIRQVVTNLMGNAVKFTEVGHVLVDVRGEMQPDGQNVRLHFDIIDTGIGIPQDKLDAIFEKFSQVDTSSTRKHEGTGLGLAITTRLIDLMDGKIGVSSSEGEGSTFWFEITLPVAGTRSNRRSAPVDVTGSRILIIDDNKVNRSILLEQTSSWKLDSCAASSGAEGLAVLEKAAELGVGVDCIILDYQMPDMNGEEVARRIRSIPAIAATPIIILTSVDQTLSSESLRKLNIDAHLIKPARSEQLLQEIIDVIQRHRDENSAKAAVFLAGANASSADTAPDDDGFIDTDLDDWDDGFSGDSETANATLIGNHSPVNDTMSQSSAPAPVAELAHGEQLDLIIAEDNEVNQLVFTQILEDTEYKFRIFDNGKLALEAWQQLKPRMILMDVSMPEMNGLEAAAAIRKIEKESKLPRTPIVGVTAHALKGDRDRCIEAGMDDYITKPVSPDMLATKIGEWLGIEETVNAKAG